jgi:hypothetical protein
MGTSTDAILAFGFDLGEELPEALTQMDEDADEAWDFEAWLEDRLGLTDKEYKERRAAIDAFPFDLVIHCSYDYPMYFLAARGTEQTAKRGYPEAVAMKEATPEQAHAMRNFCEEFGIEWSEPKWHIFSLWG